MLKRASKKLHYKDTAFLILNKLNLIKDNLLLTPINSVHFFHKQSGEKNDT